MKTIEIVGCRQHNLKDISLEIPRDQLVVVTGLSGSGKSSLAFDTIYAEGQRRYMETLSAYARQFIGVLERPALESINGLSPIIAIEQKTTGRNPRSTVGTITEIYDFLRLLYARIAVAYSPVTGKPMVKYTTDQIVELIQKEYSGKKIYLLAPLVNGRKGHYRELFESLLKKGYNQVRVDGTMIPLSEAKPLDRYRNHFIELVVDKLMPSAAEDVQEAEQKRISTSVSTALDQGKGMVAILEFGSEDRPLRYFSRFLMCADSGMSLPEPAPHSFSFNSPQGACPKCKGLGYIARIDFDKIFPDRSKSINGGGIAPLGSYKDNNWFRVLESMSKKLQFSLNDPISQLPDDIIDMLVYGTNELFRVNLTNGIHLAPFPGVVSKLEKDATGDDDITSSSVRAERFMQEDVCPECGGSRLKSEALLFKIDGKNIYEASCMDIDSLYDWVKGLPEKLSEKENIIGGELIKELCSRIGFLSDVGLNYLQLGRSTRSLSGGESQRIRLATQIGSRLVNVLYILDEPSIGLHQRDNVKLISSLCHLRDEGNSVMVVEHDRQMMESADWLVDLGPGAGVHGGELLYNGKPKQLLRMSRKQVKALGSLTAEYLTGLRKIEVPASRRTVTEGVTRFIDLYGAKGNNLKDVHLHLPLGVFVGISGVSGSGKSSLINDTLVKAVSRKLYRTLQDPLPYDRIEGLENIDKLIVVDQAPIGRTPRSNPATYTNLFSDIRKLFEQTRDAKIRGFKAGRFSFNVTGGRCEACKGAGVQTIEMNFLPSVYVTCKECGGKRYNPQTLAVKYKGKSINDVLEMTISQAVEFFESIPAIYQKVKVLEEVGLGYVKLGQPSTTLSGGESQRVKLATELSRRSTGKSLFVLDEPTTGLHFEDIKVLMSVLQKLVEQGNTVVVIEHNLDVIKSVDYLIDMGPDGGAAGGRIIACGTPEEVAANPASVTGQFLKDELEQK